VRRQANALYSKKTPRQKEIKSLRPLKEGIDLGDFWATEGAVAKGAVCNNLNVFAQKRLDKLR
jgi:hypothetical protein